MFRPEEFLALARALMGRARDEATLRTVISRAYYAAFLIARHRAGKPGLSHTELWRQVRLLDRECALAGGRMRTIRNSADYGDPMPDLESNAAWCVVSADWLIRTFGNAQ